MSELRVEHWDDDRFMAAARAWDHPVPIEQAPAWDAFDQAVDGRSPWRRLAVLDGADAVVALIALSQFAGRGFTYLWAKHGPMWPARPDAAAEAAAREAVLAYVRWEAPEVVFVRMHAWHPAPGLCELLQTVTYDRTVVIDLTRSEDEILASFTKRGRYKTRRALKDADMTVTDESGMSAAQFAELYEIYRETAERDGFGIFPMSVYTTMIESLGEHARVFVARRHDTGPEGNLVPGRAVSWVVSLVHDGGGVDFYAGGNREARDTNAAIALKWHIFTTLKAEGVTRYDLMGVGSERVPQLAGVGEFKHQFGDDVEIDGAWDVPVKPMRYRSLVLALRAKRALRR
ncbi:lipid II:glycine glycyltransferase FemX [Demequina sp.]|uniref:lipid II:glycine glycyltransferase FemX n=1 Tax=Demequina sp. TaxID=2050685 RepID=UPI003A88CCFB